MKEKGYTYGDVEKNLIVCWSCIIAGHNLQIEQDEVFNCLVTEWLRRVEKFDLN